MLGWMLSRRKIRRLPNSSAKPFLLIKGQRLGSSILSRGELQLLIVNDAGKGFDVETAKQGKGLGLTSMRERIRLVNGKIEIQSKPMGGTTIHVRAPLRSEDATQRAAG